ncbi:putative colanic acid biosynthesis acetyltransferase [Pontixanthobacter luteolus]|uniref:putative colanic acid biosynthesis acetyltransferase n=1 Tax=Pontixanthobacter luteolus TaxID=295089 RepID=UPI002303813B|nr:putative colanic acid biosynthesis acetyltransferase [Pontixanthobacter luteolus]
MEKGSVVYASATIWLPRNLSMAERATLGPGAECYNIAPVTLGPGAIVSQRAFLCTGSHDYENPHFQLTARPIVLDANCWIAAEAFVGPGVEVYEGAVLAARGCTVSDLPAWTVWGGNPARQIAERTSPDQSSLNRATD